MTIFGIIWILIVLTQFVLSIENLAILLVLSTLFECATLFSLFDTSFSALDITSILFIIKFLFHKSGVRTLLDSRHGLFSAFVLYALLGGLLSLTSFNGYEFLLYDASASGDWFAVVGTEKASISIRFFSSIARLTLYVFAFICMSGLFQSYEEKNRNRVFKKCVYGSLGIVLVVGAIQFLNTLEIINVTILMESIHTQDLAENSAYWNHFNALYSIFSEPSHCGPWLMAMGWGFLLKGNTTTLEYGLAACCFIEGVLTFSSTSLLVFGALLVLYVLKNVRRNAVRTLLLVAIVVIVVLISPQAHHMIDLALNKLSTGSGLIRTAMIDQSHQVFVDTCGLGLGFNAINGMTFLGSMLAQVGVIGTSLFVAFLIVFYKALPQTLQGRYVKYLLLGILFSLLISSSGLIYAKRLWFVIFLSTTVGNPTSRFTYQEKTEGTKRYGTTTNS